MEPTIKGAILVLPAADTTESLNWWTEVCGFKETFRDSTPPTYAGTNRGEAYLHISGMDDKALARKVGDQTMVRLAVKGQTGGAICCRTHKYRVQGGAEKTAVVVQAEFAQRSFGGLEVGVAVTCHGSLPVPELRF